MSVPSRLALVVSSAALYVLAFPPWRLWPLALVALVPLLLALRDLRPARAALIGCAWGSLAIWGIGWWVAPAISFYYQQPWWFGVVFCLVGCVILWGSHYALFAALAATVAPGRSRIGLALTLAVTWVACELVRARLVTGEPWMLLGYAVADRPILAQVADLGGVYLVSFVLALVNTAIAAALAPTARGGRAAVLALPLVVIATAVGYGAVRLARPLSSGPSVPVTLVQGNTPVRGAWRRELYGQGLDHYLALSRNAAPQGLLVWPESAVTFFLAEEPDYRARVGRVLDALDAELVVGGPYREGADARVFNSAFLLPPSGTITARYDKARLLAFGEYFPLRFLTLLQRRFDQVSSIAPGDGSTLLATRAGRAAVVICFEAIFPELVRERVRRGAELVINLSNDAWLRGAGPEQHLQMVVLRAIENRVWVVRATSTGISALIDPHGRLHGTTAADTDATLAGEIAPVRAWTLYKQVGDLFAWLCVLATGVAVLRRVRGVAS